MTTKDNISVAKEVLKIEADAVSALINKVDDQFDQAVEAIRNCKGRVIVTGMGKSGHIAKKIADLEIIKEFFIIHLLNLLIVINRLIKK